MVLTKRKRREETRTFNWSDLPGCKYKIKTKLPTGATVYLCQIHRGTGRHGQYCSSVGIEPHCKSYAAKRKWGRSIYEMAGDLL